MIAFPNCKINLGLKVLRKREDGFHDLETIFYPINLTDALEIIATEPIEGDTHNVTFQTSGLAVPGDTSDNLCVKAYHLLKKDFPFLPPVSIYLLKKIPMGAGLGGGSSDGAFTIRILNEKFHLNLSKSKQVEYAAALGSDCPFFIINKPCFATSRGEMLEEITLNLSTYTLLIVHPGIHINTGWAFSQISPGQAEPGPSLVDVVKQPVAEWKQWLVNDFEIPVYKQYPELEKLKAHLYDNGALYASLSGSGSTIFGIFDRDVSLEFPDGYKVIKILGSTA